MLTGCNSPRLSIRKLLLPGPMRVGKLVVAAPSLITAR